MIVDLNITEYIRSLMKEEKNDLSHIESEPESIMFSDRQNQRRRNS